ncbi:CRISPR-associated protein Cas4 [Desulfobacterales bacterium HSG2]|nr:CRISPR-associated protein Cas4 [Desulfobacterales bacterium HSG2]
MKICLTPSEIIAYLYCPRFIYFTFCLGLDEHEEKRFKVLKGREVHKDKTKINKAYLRKRIGVTEKEAEVYLSSEKLHLRGIVDEVLMLDDGTMAPLDYKFAEYKQREFKTYKTQSLAYGMLISENYNRPVRKGFLVYTRSKNKLVDIEFRQKDIDGVQKIIEEMLLIIQKGFYPKKTSSKAKCDDCAFRTICV